MANLYWLFLILTWSKGLSQNTENKLGLPGNRARVDWLSLAERERLRTLLLLVTRQRQATGWDAHDYPGNFVNQEFMPEEIKGTKLYDPGKNAREEDMRKRLKAMWREKYGY